MERKWGWIKDKPDHRDFKFQPKLEQLPISVDLTAQIPIPVVDQGQLGSCTANAIAGALAYLQDKENVAMRYASRLFIYYNERVIEGTVSQDAGAEIRDGIKSIVSQGFCPESDWPYDISQFAVQPPPFAYTDALKDLVKSYQSVNVSAVDIQNALASGFPVVVGFTVYDSFMNATDGNIPMPNTQTENVLGGHAVLVVGYDQATSKFKFLNSWGTGWGNGGFGTLPFAYLDTNGFGSDYWIVTADTYQPTPTPTPTPTPKPGPGCLPGSGLVARIFRMKF